MCMHRMNTVHAWYECACIVWKGWRQWWRWLWHGYCACGNTWFPLYQTCMSTVYKVQIGPAAIAKNERDQLPWCNLVCLINCFCLPRDTETPGHRDPGPEDTWRWKSIINLRNPHPPRYPIGINMQINQIKLQNKIKVTCFNYLQIQLIRPPPVDYGISEAKSQHPMRAPRDGVCVPKPMPRCVKNWSRTALQTYSVAGFDLTDMAHDMHCLIAMLCALCLLCMCTLLPHSQHTCPHVCWPEPSWLQQ